MHVCICVGEYNNFISYVLKKTLSRTAIQFSSIVCISILVIIDTPQEEVMAGITSLELQSYAGLRLRVMPPFCPLAHYAMLEKFCLFFYKVIPEIHVVFLVMVELMMHVSMNCELFGQETSTHPKKQLSNHQGQGITISSLRFTRTKFSHDTS